MFRKPRENSRREISGILCGEFPHELFLRRQLFFPRRPAAGADLLQGDAKGAWENEDLVILDTVLCASVFSVI